MTDQPIDAEALPLQLKIAISVASGDEFVDRGVIDSVGRLLEASGFKMAVIATGDGETQAHYYIDAPTEKQTALPLFTVTASYHHGTDPDSVAAASVAIGCGSLVGVTGSADDQVELVANVQSPDEEEERFVFFMEWSLSDDTTNTLLAASLENESGEGDDLKGDSFSWEDEDDE